ncbi:hypothetical protein V8C86DRAFT_2708471, partial [Haematococcus lacustris]
QLILPVPPSPPTGHAFHGHIWLLAGLASASTAAVTTIVAATTEAEQADAAPASGARSAHDAAVTHSELAPLTAMAYARSGAISNKMQFAHRSAKILVFSSTGVKKGCDDLTASGLNLSQILTDVELLYPFLSSSACWQTQMQPCVVLQLKQSLMRIGSMCSG